MGSWGIRMSVKLPVSHGRDGMPVWSKVCSARSLALPRHVQGSQQWVTAALGAGQAQVIDTELPAMLIGSGAFLEQVPTPQSRAASKLTQGTGDHFYPLHLMNIFPNGAHKETEAINKGHQEATASLEQPSSHAELNKTNNQL